MSTMIAVPDDLVEQVKSVTHTNLDKFLISAARKEIRQIRARQLREEYERAHRRRLPREVYETTLAEVVAFETRYKLSSEQFLQDFEAGVMDEDSADWTAFYRWRAAAYGLRRMEKEYGFRREVKTGGGQT